MTRIIDTLTPLERIQCGMPLPADLDWIREKVARVAELEAILREAILIQRNNYGHGMDTHLELHTWADKAEPILNKQ